jgi:hypothetical protein
VLDELNRSKSTNANLPPDPIIRVIQELLDPVEFEREGLNRDAALEDLNTILARDGLEAYLDKAGRCYVRNVETETTSAVLQMQSRPLTFEEIERRKHIESYLKEASEDEFTEDLFVPLLKQLGFQRVTPSGHRDKLLEYGKDLWMKYRLPTDHSIYFGAQIKADKISSSSKDLEGNIGEIISQVQMILRTPIFDPESNRKHLLDHVFIVSTGEITKQAKNLLAGHLDQEARRHILFIDSSDLVELVIVTNTPLPTERETDPPFELDDDLPF